MLSKRKIRKMVKEELETPPDFKEFCNKCGIEFTASAAKPKRRIWIPFASAGAVATVAVCACIPLMLPASGGSLPPRYEEADVYRTNVSDEYFMSLPGIVMFDLQYADDYSIIKNVKTLKNDVNLGYEIRDIEYNFTDNSVNYSYDFEYSVYSYGKFDFKSIENYLNAESRFEFNEITFEYRIMDLASAHAACIKFDSGKYEYFIELKGCEGITEINNESVQTFLETAFGD